MQNPEKRNFFCGKAGGFEENWILKIVKFILNSDFQPSMITMHYICSHGKSQQKPPNVLEKGPLFVITQSLKKNPKQNKIILICTDSNCCECTKKSNHYVIFVRHKMLPCSQEAVRGNNPSSVKHRFMEKCSPLSWSHWVITATLNNWEWKKMLLVSGPPLTHFKRSLGAVTSGNNTIISSRKSCDRNFRIKESSKHTQFRKWYVEWKCTGWPWCLCLCELWASCSTWAGFWRVSGVSWCCDEQPAAP